MRARSAIVYDERARAFVREWKERGRRALALEAATLLAEVIPPPDVEALTHVPGDPERAWKRGDVAPRALAAALSRVWDVQAVGFLRRTHALPRQRTVCVVDDVYTSGATADACATALRRAGARRVEIVTLARAVR